MNLDLTQTERNSQTWLKIETAIKAELDRLRVKNDGALEPYDTATLRGKISAFKDFLVNPPEPDADQS